MVVILTSLTLLVVPVLVVLMASKGSDCRIIHDGTDYVVVRKPKILKLVVLSLVFLLTQARRRVVCREATTYIKPQLRSTYKTLPSWHFAPFSTISFTLHILVKPVFQKALFWPCASLCFTTIVFSFNYLKRLQQKV